MPFAQTVNQERQYEYPANLVLTYSQHPSGYGPTPPGMPYAYPLPPPPRQHPTYNPYPQPHQHHHNLPPVPPAPQIRQSEVRVQSTYDSRNGPRNERFPFFPKEERIDDIDPEIFGEPERTSAAVIDHRKKPSYVTDVWQMNKDTRPVAEGLPPIGDDDLNNARLHARAREESVRRGHELASLNSNYEYAIEPEMVERGMEKDHTILYPNFRREDEIIPEPLRTGGYILNGDPIHHGYQILPEATDHQLTMYQFNQYQDIGQDQLMYGAGQAAYNGVLGQRMLQYSELTHDRRPGVIEGGLSLIQRALFGGGNEGTDRKLGQRVRTGRHVHSEPVRVIAQDPRNGRIIAPEHYGTRNHPRKIQLNGPLVNLAGGLRDPDNPTLQSKPVVNKHSILKTKEKHSEGYSQRKVIGVGLDSERLNRIVPGQMVPHVTKSNRKLNIKGPLAQLGAAKRHEIAGHFVPGLHIDRNPNRVIVTGNPANRGAEEVGRFFHQWNGAKIQGTTKNQRSDRKIIVSNQTNMRGQEDRFKVGQMAPEIFKVKPDKNFIPRKILASATNDGHHPRAKDGMNIIQWKKSAEDEAQIDHINKLQSRVGKIEEASGHNQLANLAQLIDRNKRKPVELHKFRNPEVGAVAPDIHDKPAPRVMKFDDGDDSSSTRTTRKTRRNIRETTAADLDKLEKLIEEA